MIGGITSGPEGLEPFHASGTVVARPFHTTVPRNDRRGTLERFSPKCAGRRRFSTCQRWNDQPFERGALAPLSGRSVPLPFLGGTSGTAGRSSPPIFCYPAGRHRQRHAVVAGVFRNIGMRTEGATVTHRGHNDRCRRSA
jgi:hypothetical protein